MERYLNKAGDSGVTGFVMGDDFIKIWFTGGVAYLYNYVIPGKKHVEKMKKLARAGRGLSTYIAKNVGDRYAGKQGD